MAGEIWRIISFVFVPPTTSIFFAFFVLYFYLMIGRSLENQWGTFKFNIYYLLGAIGIIVSCIITGGVGTSYYLNLSLFLAFSYLYPNFEVRLFFFLPVKMKYLAILYAIIVGIDFLGGGLNTKLLIVFSLINFLIFFGKDIIFRIRNRGNSVKRRNDFRNKILYYKDFQEKKSFHKCSVCGITEKDNKFMDFRYCSECDGDHEYCMDHLHNHEHIKKVEH
jgi:hypothetical protein